MLRYKDYVQPTLARFFRHKNDIDVFIEDIYDDEFYLTLLKRIADKNGIKIGKLIPLGGRKSVLDACINDQIDRDRNRIYIIDGDLYLIHDKNPKGIKHLHIHNSYCIENFLLDENAFIEILHDCFVCPKKDLEKLFSFDSFLKRISKPLIELFLHYGIAFELGLSIKTVSNGVGTLCHQVKNITILADEKVNNKIEELKIEIQNSISEEDYIERIYQLRQKWNYDIDTLLKIVSAKDYLLPLTQFRFAKISGKSGMKISRESLRLRLAKLCKLDRLSSLEQAIIAHNK
jgi:hypothetical protein